MKQIAVIIGLMLVHQNASPQNSGRHKIAVFAPLYLDTAFDSTGQLKADKSIPKQTISGLDFYLGVQYALDSLQKRNAALDVFVFDSRGKETSGQLVAKEEIRDAEMIIGSSNSSETRVFADAAFHKKIPFISVTLPNDAGIVNNPFFVVLNSTLQTHVDGIYRFLQRYHPLDNIIVFRKPGTQEDQIKNYFTESGKSSVASALNIKFVDIKNEIYSKNLAHNLDSTKKTVCIAGSLDEVFGLQLLQALAPLSKSFPMCLVGMPTWENMNFNHPAFSNLEVIYSSSFSYNRASPLEIELSSDYLNKMNSKPSDLFFKGYETTLRFSLLLLDTKSDIASNLTRKGNSVLTPFDIQPVFKDKKSMALDYFENKHLYFIRVFGGVKNVLYQ